MHRSFKRNLVIGLAALAVVACAGVAYATTQNSGPATRQAFLNDVAKRLHVTPKQLSSALNGAAIDQLQAEVKAGRLTQSQANRLEQRMKNGATTPLPLVPGLAGPPRFFGVPGHGGFGGPLGYGFGFGRPGLAAAASYLGLSDAQLFGQLSAGKSLAEIAAAKGKTVAGLEQAMTDQVKKALDAAVKAKAIPSGREAQILNSYSTRLKQEINQKGLLPARRGFFRGPGGPGAPAAPGGSGKPAQPYGPGAPARPYGPAFPATPVTPGAAVPVA